MTPITLPREQLRAPTPAVGGLTEGQINAALAIWFGTEGTFEERMRGAIQSALLAKIGGGRG